MSRELAALLGLAGLLLLAVGVAVAWPGWLGFDQCRADPYFDCGAEPLSVPVGLLLVAGGSACLVAAARAWARSASSRRR
jgi:hypothetical protein